MGLAFAWASGGIYTEHSTRDTHQPKYELMLHPLRLPPSSKQHTPSTPYAIAPWIQLTHWNQHFHDQLRTLQLSGNGSDILATTRDADEKKIGGGLR